MSADVCTCTWTACFCGRLSLCSGRKRVYRPGCPAHKPLAWLSGHGTGTTR